VKKTLWTGASKTSY